MIVTFDPLVKVKLSFHYRFCVTLSFHAQADWVYITGLRGRPELPCPAGKAPGGQQGSPSASHL